MSRLPTLLAVLAFSMLSRLSHAAEDQDWVALFNGRDLSGWHPVNVAPATFSVKDGMIVSTGVPTGVMRSDKQYENFILELEYRHMHKGGNAGVFVWADPLTSRGVPFARGIEVQVLDGHETANYTSHGDVFSIHGAKMKPDRAHPGGWERCLPSEKRAKPSPEWNHYRIVCNDGALKLSVNGKEVSGGSLCNPRKGYICLESEGSECHFRNIRIKELPSTGAKAEETAPAADGFVSLYSGLDLDGWVRNDAHKGHWQPRDWVLAYDGKAAGDDPHLWSAKEYGDFVMICDWRWPTKPKPGKCPVVLPNGEYEKDDSGKAKEVEVPVAGDSGIYLRGNDKSQVNIWCWPVGSGEVYGYRTDAKQPAAVRAGVTPKAKADRPIGEWNRFIITMKGDRLTVNLNGQTVIENAQLPDVPARGRIALQHHGDAIEFANIYIKELRE